MIHAQTVISAPTCIELVEMTSERGKLDMVRPMARQLDRLDVVGLTKVIHEATSNLLTRDQAGLVAMVVREYVWAATP